LKRKQTKENNKKKKHGQRKGSNVVNFKDKNTGFGVPKATFVNFA
jgi:hypothetical protein